jgi:hypothetical protein
MKKKRMSVSDGILLYVGIFIGGLIVRDIALYGPPWRWKKN